MKQHNIYNKVKTLMLATVVAASGAGVMSSCSLDTEPRNEITFDKFWNEKTDVEQVIAGCYQELQSRGALSRMMIWGEFRSENVINNGPIDKDVNLERVIKEGITANNEYCKWEDFYRIINRCNTVIKYAATVAEKDPSYNGSEVKAHIAEVTALRSLCYFYLIRTFRDVPYTEVAYTDDDQHADIPATPFNEVLQKLIASLEAVKGDAPVRYPDSQVTNSYDYNCNRVTQPAINALLCELYLWAEDYDNCIKAGQAVIDAKKQQALDPTYKTYKYTDADFADFDGFPLIGTKVAGDNNTYGKAFNNIFVSGNSVESILELCFTKGSGQSMPSNEPVNNFFGALGRTPWVKMSSYVALDAVNGTYNIFSKDNAGLDARAVENMAYSGGKPDYINKYTAASGVNIKGSNTISDFVSKTSWGGMYPTVGSNQDSQNKSNFIIYRLSDVMLLMAEAYAQKIQATTGALEGNDRQNYEKAFQLVNAVNKRSVLQQELKDTLKLESYSSKDQITDLVYDERQRELMFEGKRYFDLVRRAMREGNTEYLTSKAQNKDTELKNIITARFSKMDAIFWPYHIDELKVNDKLVQNSAFGSGENSSFK